MKRLNHMGVQIEVRNEETYEAVLTLPNNTQIRTGTKLFGNPTEFQVYLESQADSLRKASDEVERLESETRALERLHREAVSAVDGLKSEDYDGDMAAFAFAAQQKAGMVRTHYENMMLSRGALESSKRIVNGIISDLTEND